MVINENGSIHGFRIYLPEARSVQLVGTFTGWQRGAISMNRDAAGWWVVELDLTPGDHLFNYLVDGSAWVPDYAASGIKANGFGGWVSQLHVPAVVQTRPRQLVA